MDFVQSVGRRQEVPKGKMGGFLTIGAFSLNGYEKNCFYRNLGPDQAGMPHFRDHSYLAGGDRLHDGRAAVASDFDRDGDIDLLVQSFEKPVALLINEADPGNWLQVKLTGTQSNRDAIGAKVIVTAGRRRQIREIASTSGYLSGSSPIVHFGLGTATTIERLQVLWPSGRETILTSVPIKQRLEIRETQSMVPTARLFGPSSRVIEN